MAVYEFEEDVSIHPECDPEKVTLGDQTLDEVEKILEESEKAEREWRRKKHQETLDAIKGACGEGLNEPKLSYDDELSDCCLPNLDGARESYGFKREVDQFALWRRLADVKVGNPNLEPQVFCPTKDLMDYLLLKLNRSFPKLELSWTESNWNPCLWINNSPTKISMEKLALAYQGLLNVTDELNAQAVICNIVTKKLKELFI